MFLFYLLFLTFALAQPSVEDQENLEPPLDPSLGPDKRTTKAKALATYDGYEMRKDKLIADGTIQVF